MQITDKYLSSENPDFKFVSVLFAPYTGIRTYTYKTLLKGLEPGDLVLVWVRNQELKIVEVTEVLHPSEVESDPNIRYSWVVQKVDNSHYAECLEMESALAEKLRRAPELAGVTRL